ncbi:nitrile hydratase accessory protein [uncultured Roseobacter sp.]|uniref:nitrile hydratase accessory protein n=1 Tax=uncultured Roseobacter sp. TaxID=114847 RepID=UPI002618F71F|nr:nitrile hydratase accessory protein [uncultured Roseobacter sp.]
MTARPEPVFSEPWHAQVFALTVHLNEAGHFDWPEWAVAFGATLKKDGLSRELDGGDDYFAAWLETLEAFLGDKGLAGATELQEKKAAWEAAFLRTPHGAPVRL